MFGIFVSDPLSIMTSRDFILVYLCSYSRDVINYRIQVPLELIDQLNEETIRVHNSLFPKRGSSYIPRTGHNI